MAPLAAADDGVKQGRGRVQRRGRRPGGGGSGRGEPVPGVGGLEQRSGGRCRARGEVEDGRGLRVLQAGAAGEGGGVTRLDGSRGGGACASGGVTGRGGGCGLAIFGGGAPGSMQDHGEDARERGGARRRCSLVLVAGASGGEEVVGCGGLTVEAVRGSGAGSSSPWLDASV
nr:glycine-rich cell wall structural protein 1-like [Aegilops tauschii subsp. strangulata]